MIVHDQHQQAHQRNGMKQRRARQAFAASRESRRELFGATAVGHGLSSSRFSAGALSFKGQMLTLAVSRALQLTRIGGKGAPCSRSSRSVTGMLHSRTPYGQQ